MGVGPSWPKTLAVFIIAVKSFHVEWWQLHLSRGEILGQDKVNWGLIQRSDKIANFNLSKYEDVRNRASDIYQRLSEGSMTCDGAWPTENVAKFKQWMEDGMAP